MINSADTPSTQVTATQIMSSSAQIANFLVTAGRVLQGAAGDNGNLTTQNASDSLIKSLVSVIKTGNGPINMNDSTLLKTVLVNGAKEVITKAQASGLPPKFDSTNFTDKIGKMANTVTAVLKGAADNIINAVNKSNSAEPLALLTNMDKISTFAQNDAGKSLQQIAVALDMKDDVALQKVLKNQVDLYTGLPATQAIENNIVQTIKSVPSILAADKAIKNPAPPGTSNPGANTPGTTTPGANTPGTNNPGINNPGASNPGAPGTTTPGASNPGTTTPGAPDINNPGASNPGAPDINNPGASNPGAPDTNTPGTNNPGAPNTSNPGASNPGAPGTTTPGASNPDTNNPGASNPSIENPGTPGTITTPGTTGAPDTSNSVNPDNTVQSTGNVNAHSNQAISEDLNNPLSTIALVGTPPDVHN
jgi:hypothetical protein